MYNNQSFRKLCGSLVVCCGVLGLLCQCDEEKQANSFLSMRLLDSEDQPTESSLGVLLAISVRGGNAIRFDVTGGTLDFPGSNGATQCVGTGDASSTTSVREVVVLNPLGSVAAVASVVVAVHPVGQQEAWVSAELGKISDGDGVAADANDCSGLHFVPLGIYASEVVSLGRAPVSAGTGGSGQGGSSELLASGGSSTGGIGGNGGAQLGSSAIGGQASQTTTSSIDGGA